MLHTLNVGTEAVFVFIYIVMDVDFCENLANEEPMSRGGQLLSETEAELSGDEGALRPVPGLEV